jgi:hypothetical protein
MLWDAGLYADADLSDSTLPKKVRNGEIAQYNYIFGTRLSLIFHLSTQTLMSYFYFLPFTSCRK